MKNILYLDDYINFYSNKLKKIINYKPYKKTLFKGRIINKNKFIKSFLKLKKVYKINNSLLNEDILIIVNSSLKDEDRCLIEVIMEELNYKKVQFINELELIDVDKNGIFINYNYQYFYIYHKNIDGKIKLNMYDNDDINKKIIIKLLREINKNKIIIAGKNYLELINIIKNNNFNYFYYEDNSNLFINLLLKNIDV